MKTIIVIPVIILMFICNIESFSQCSDAGVCIIGKKTNELFRKNNSNISLGYVLGRSGDPDDISYNTIKLDAEFQIAKLWSVTASMPFSYNTGPSGDASGPGDLSVLGTMLFPIEGIVALSFTVGGKFSTGSVNAGDSLPQAYQPGLGTNDLLLGIGLLGYNFNAGIAYQKPFGRSSNSVTRLKRSDDLMFRAGYNMQFDKLNVKAEVLGIKRLRLSSIRVVNSTPEVFEDAADSDFFQVNLIGQLSYMLTNQIDITGFAALPLLKRDTNYDGTKRAFSGGLTLSYRFRL
jgi:hypothetical protein